MCDKCCNIDNIIFNRNGTNQYDRVQSDLNPDEVQLHDFSIEDWLLFAFHFAEKINYFTVKDFETTSENWQSFFKVLNIDANETLDRTSTEYDDLKANIATILEGYESEGNLTPHLTLFVCFLKLLELSKSRFNSLTKKHLDFFYGDILQIEKLEPQEDKVHIIFELAKKITELEIAEGTALDAQKDKIGINLLYKTDANFVANKGKVTHLKSSYNDIYAGEFKHTTVTNSLDGLGKELAEDSPFWYPFGYNSTENNYQELPDTQLGFSIASPLLFLEEGIRNVAVIITFKEAIEHTAIDINTLANEIEVAYSSEKKWQVISLSASKIAMNVYKNNDFYGNSISSNQLQLVFSIPKELPPVVAFNKEVLGDNIQTDLPVVRFLLKTENSGSHTFFRKIVKKAIKSIKIKVAVSEIKELALENDYGNLNTNKPFLPFTSQPIKGGAFQINSPEVFKKEWKQLYINAKWLDTPESFTDHYSGYKTSFLDQTSQANYEDALLAEEDPVVAANQPDDSISDKDDSVSSRTVFNTSDAIVTSDAYFKATLSQLYKEEWKAITNNLTLFEKQNDAYYLNTFLDNNDTDIDEDGAIKLILNQPFLHVLYPTLYTLSFSSEIKVIPIPNKPYTPLIETIEMSYTAEKEVDFDTNNSEDSYTNNRIQLFHNDIFGAYEEHKYLKKKAKEAYIISNDNSCYLVPDYCHGGELYIGISDLVPTQQVSLLIQVLEGSENPNVPTFEGKQGVSWSVLCNNYWKPLSDEVLVNEVDNFLRSGIVQIKIPEQATTTNTKFNEELIWLRAKMHKSFDAVCKVFGIYAQATTATFQNNNNNELSHLENGLSATTISKLVTRVPQVKSIAQPFSSFAGKATETDIKYYQRVSERLRHKNRAINLWDYEHLVLEKFPEVFRVKCLNHTSKTSFKAPGNILLVVIPDIINRNVFDIYEPRLGQTTLNEITTYVNSLNGMQVETHVDNAQYERVYVDLQVKFYPEYDENFYKEKLKEDINKLLSPWAFDASENIAFGIELNNSLVIDYIEKLSYVDYLASLQLAKVTVAQDLQLSEGNQGVLEDIVFENKVAPSSPKHILVAAKTHNISTEIFTCTNVKFEEEEQCQY